MAQDFSLLDPTYLGKLPSYMKGAEDLTKYVTKQEKKTPGFESYMKEKHSSLFEKEGFVSRPGYESGYWKKYGEWAGGLDVTPPTGEEEEEIRETTRKQMQAQIDTIDEMYARLITREEEAGTERLGRVRAMGARGGLLGTPMGETQKVKTEQFTAEQIKSVEAEREAKKHAILAKIDDRAAEEIKLKREEALAGQEAYLKYLKSVQDKAIEDWSGLAESGVSLTRLKTNQEYYDQAMEELDLDEFGLDMWWESKMPKEQQLDYSEIQYRGENNNIWLKRIAFDPKTGEKTENNYDLNLPWQEEPGIEYKTTILDDGTVLLMPKTFDSDKTLEEQIIIYGEKGEFAKPEEPEEPEYLSPSEAEKLGVPYGTTKAQAREMGITIEGEKDDWNQGRKFIDDNPEANYEELETGLRENTKLSDGDIKSLLGERGKEKKKEAEMFLTDDQMKKVVIALVKSIGKEDAVKAVDQGTITINKKDTDLSSEQIKRIKEIIEEEYPKGRTWWQKALPGGK